MWFLAFFLGISEIVSGQQLYYQAFQGNTFISAQDWTIVGGNGIYSTCGTTRLFGGYGKFGTNTKVMKLIQLPPHYSMIITFEFWRLDDWNDEIFYFYVDETLVYQNKFGSSGTSKCGQAGDNDQVITISKTINHNSQSTFIFLTTDLDESATDESWGIRNFQLYLYLCPAGCKTCDAGDSRGTCIPWSLIDQSLLSITQVNMDGWSIENGSKETTICECIPLLGGFKKAGQNTLFQKTIILPPHSLIKIKFRFAFLDSWNNEIAYLYADGVQIWQKRENYQSRKIQSSCGWIYDDIFSNQVISLTHSASKITLEFNSNLDQDYENESFGLRDFELFIHCKFGASYDQACNQICGDGILQGTEICDDGNIYPFDGCFNCQYSCIEGCSDCFKEICLECQIGWQYNYVLNQCQPNIQDLIIIQNEECDDNLQLNICKNGQFIIQDNCLIYQFGICLQCQNGFILLDNICESLCNNLIIVNQIQCQDNNNIDQFDNCNQCQYDIYEGCLEIQQNQCIKCQIGWQFKYNKCIPICGDQIINGQEQCDIQQYNCQNCQYQCQNECIECYYGKCYNCIDGYKINQYKCQTICGDQQINGLEQCDDNNIIQLDGCYNCQNNCQIECILCQKGKCLNCIYGWQLNNKGICEYQCGDNKLALFSIEECDNTSNECYNCKLQCCNECNICVYGQCYECNFTFTLINQQCLPICGDGLISIGYENCDDMNEIQYDGCYQCQYQCRKYCKNCIKGICYDACSYGYYMINYDCQTQCGDQIIAGYEECDDNNNIQFDGCYNCYYSCPNYCQICNEGQCYQCNQGYILYYTLNYCQPGCGDGNVAIPIEQCDDANNDNNDGCSSKCLIETDYVCKNSQYSFSECTYEKYPKFMVTFVEQKYIYQYVSLTFSQKVKTITHDLFSNYIELQLIGASPEFYSLNLKIIQEAADYVTDVYYLVEIQINETLTNPPYLKVILHDYLYNSNEAPLFNLVDEVNLKIPKYMNDEKKQLAISLQNASQNLISSLGGLGIIVVLLGNSFLLWGLLELLQQQSYLRFINVVFPENLFIYFEINNIISLQPILRFFHFDQITNIAIDTPFLESYEKFKFYEINADIISNLETQLFIIIFMFISFQASKHILKGIYKLRYYHFNDFGFCISKAIYKVKNSASDYFKEIKKDGVKLILISNSWDLFFISFIQIQSCELIGVKQYFSLSLALLIIYSAIIIISNFINTPSSSHLDFIQYWSERYQLFQTLKKIVFIAILVLFQLNQQIQTILLSSICFLFLIYILIFKPLEDNSEYAKLIIMELTIFIFTTTQFIYWENMEQLISYDQQILLGWFHISIFVTTLVVNIVLQLFLMIKVLVVRLKKRQVIQDIYNKSSNPFPLQN